MSDKKTVPGYAGTLDMQDPASIRAYVRDALAMNVDPTVAGLKRLEMLSEVADKLELEKAKKSESAPAPSTPGDIDNVMEFSEEVRKELQARRYVTRNQGK